MLKRVELFAQACRAAAVEFVVSEILSSRRTFCARNSRRRRRITSRGTSDTALLRRYIDPSRVLRVSRRRPVNPARSVRPSSG